MDNPLNPNWKETHEEDWGATHDERPSGQDDATEAKRHGDRMNDPDLNTEAKQREEADNKKRRERDNADPPNSNVRQPHEAEAQGEGEKIVFNPTHQDYQGRTRDVQSEILKDKSTVPVSQRERINEQDEQVDNRDDADFDDDDDDGA